MKYTEDKTSSILIILQRILAGVLILVTLVIVIGTIYAFISKSANTEVEENSAQQAKTLSGNKIFTGIGRIRTKSAGTESSAVLITIAFPYNPEDAAFSEELASKVAQFRSETTQYFETFNTEELRLKTDETLQRELLARYNAQLRLGFIEALYITDYMIVE
jgi:flagellar basal body-associated protein FliL